MRIGFIFTLFLSICMYACNDDDTLLNNDKKVPFEINISQNGINIHSDEMKGGGTTPNSLTENDLLAIQVSEVKDGKSTIVATGVFKGNYFDNNNLSVLLKQNHRYNVEATMMKNHNIAFSGLSSFPAPFDAELITGDAASWVKEGQNLPRKKLDISTAGGNRYKKDRWYYGHEFTADLNQNEIAINLRRVSYAIKHTFTNYSEPLSVKVRLKGTSNYITIQNNEEFFIPAKEVGSAYRNIFGEGFHVDTDYERQFQYQIKCDTQTLKELYTPQELYNCKVNYRYTITVDCSAEIDAGVSISTEGSDW